MDVWIFMLCLLLCLPGSRLKRHVSGLLCQDSSVNVQSWMMLRYGTHLHTHINEWYFILLLLLSGELLTDRCRTDDLMPSIPVLCLPPSRVDPKVDILPNRMQQYFFILGSSLFHRVRQQSLTDSSCPTLAKHFGHVAANIMALWPRHKVFVCIRFVCHSWNMSTVCHWL